MGAMSFYELLNPGRFSKAAFGFDDGTLGCFLQCFGEDEDAPEVWLLGMTVERLRDAMASVGLSLPEVVARTLTAETRGTRVHFATGDLVVAREKGKRVRYVVIEDLLTFARVRATSGEELVRISAELEPDLEAVGVT
jgi:hypothetical protein